VCLYADTGTLSVSPGSAPCIFDQGHAAAVFLRGVHMRYQPMLGEPPVGPALSARVQVGVKSRSNQARACGALQALYICIDRRLGKYPTCGRFCSRRASKAAAGAFAVTIACKRPCGFQH